MKIVVASFNPVKINATRRAFKNIFKNWEFKVVGVNVPSGVSNQPKTDQETFQGAKNRVENVSKLQEADYWVGIEGGLQEKNGELECFAWVYIKSKDGRVGKARTGTFFLPDRIRQLVNQGKELGEADDIVFGRKNSKQKEGAVGFLTENIIDRTKYYTHAVTLALIPFKNPKLY